MKEELELQKAYQLGFYDGFTVGVEDNTFDDDMDRHLYRLGYDAGVAEYCRDQDKMSWLAPKTYMAATPKGSKWRKFLKMNKLQFVK